MMYFKEFVKISSFKISNCKICLGILSQRVQSGLGGDTLATLEEPKDESVVSAVSVSLLLQPLELAVSWRWSIWQQTFFATALFSHLVVFHRPFVVNSRDLREIGHHLHLAKRGDASACLDIVRGRWYVNLRRLPSFLGHFFDALLSSLNVADSLTSSASSTLACLHQSRQVSLPLVACLVLLQYVQRAKLLSTGPTMVGSLPHVTSYMADKGGAVDKLSVAVLTDQRGLSAVTAQVPVQILLYSAPFRAVHASKMPDTVVSDLMIFQAGKLQEPL